MTPNASRRKRSMRSHIFPFRDAAGQGCAKNCCRPSMRRDAGSAIEVQPRRATLVPSRWPVKVAPACDELLSSWLHQLAFAHGLSSRHFGTELGFGSGAWSARLDLDLPAAALAELHQRTSVDGDRITSMTLSARTWRPVAPALALALERKGPRSCDVVAVLSHLPRRGRNALFSPGLAARQRHDLSTPSAASAGSLPILPPRDRPV